MATSHPEDTEGHPQGHPGERGSEDPVGGSATSGWSILSGVGASPSAPAECPRCSAGTGGGGGWAQLVPQL